MKKILMAALFVAPALTFAQSATGTAATTTQATSTQVSCIQSALDKRENSLITAVDTFNGSIKAALTKRLAGLKDAWAQTDKSVRMSKRNEAYKAYRTDVQAANTALRTTKNASWKTFDTDMKACGVRGHGETPSQIISNNLSL